MMKTRRCTTLAYNAQAAVSPAAAEGKETGMLITAADVVDDPADAGEGGDDVGRCGLSLREQSGGMRPKRPTDGHTGGAGAGAGSPYYKDRFA